MTAPWETKHCFTMHWETCTPEKESMSKVSHHCYVNCHNLRKKWIESVTILFASLLPAVEQRQVKLLCSLCFYVCFSQSIQDTKVFVIPCSSVPYMFVLTFMISGWRIPFVYWAQLTSLKNKGFFVLKSHYNYNVLTIRSGLKQILSCSLIVSYPL